MTNLIHELARRFLGMVSLVTKLAPLVAFGSKSFTVGKYGLGKLLLPCQWPAFN